MRPSVVNPHASVDVHCLFNIQQVNRPSCKLMCAVRQKIHPTIGYKRMTNQFFAFAFT
jgi:hypothetical protein